MRTVARETRTQFVLTTHSPTILDQAFDDELFVLSAPSGVPGENQLRRVATSGERLEALKMLAGSAFFLTTGRAIICIEGERSADAEDATDLRLLSILYPRSTAFTLVPVTGKGNVINTVTRLREHVPEDIFRIRVRGLVDADRSPENIPGVKSLPVCMVENFLIDAVAISSYVSSLTPVAPVASEAIAAELQNMLVAMRGEEIALRVQQRLKSKTIRLSGSTVAEVKTAYESERVAMAALMPADAELSDIVADVASRVDAMLTDGSAILRFRGKALLRKVHAKYCASQNISFSAMSVALAKLVGQTTAVSVLLDPVIDELLGV